MAGVARSASLLLAVLAPLFSQGLAAKLRTRSAGDPPEDNGQIKVRGSDEQNTLVEEIRELASYKVNISEGAKEDWRTFDGIGALSAGASSRLLQDYPDEQRAEILDLLFKPRYGASLQVLKVEIGGDMQSTDGSEPSHMRFRGEQPDCTRGYEGWLVKEAKARNPAIRTYGLAWGVPGWIGNGTFFSQDNIKYHVAWLECMKATYSAEVDYIGIWNEMNWGSSWYVVELGEAIKAAGLSTKLVLLDAIHGISAEFLSQFQVDEKLQQLTAAVGLHYPCGEPDKARTQLLQTLAAHPSTSFWASEELSTVADWGGAGCWGRMINQNFVRMQATSSIAWSLIWSAYPNLECFGNGLLYAFSPWSGYYEVMPPVWATAHTTQFTEPGWQYLPVGAGAGNLPEGGTFVTIASPDLKEFSIILETLAGRCMYHNGCFHEKEAESTQRLRLKLSPALAASAKSGALEVWATNETHWFAQLDDATVDEDGVLRTSMPVDAIVTITTLRGASKQGRRAKSGMSDDKANIPKASAFPLPFTEDFESRDVGRSPPFFADQGGAFEVIEVKDESGKNKVLEQQVLQAPIAWIGKNPAPFSVFGSTNWTDVTFEASVNLGPQRSGISRAGPMAPFGHAVRISLLSQDAPQAHAQDVRLAGICTRVLRYNYFGKADAKPDGYCLEVVDDTKSMPYWRLTSSGALMAQQRLSNIAINKVFGGSWLKLRMDAQQAQISLFVDGESVFNLTDTALPMGQVAFGCGYHKCQFDDMAVAQADRQSTTSLQLIQVRPVNFDYSARSCEPPPQMPQLRQDFSGLVGFAFTPTAPVVLTALGRYMIRGGNPLADVHQIQLLQIMDSANYLPLATVALPSVLSALVGQASMHTTADGFIYADLASNVSLQPGIEYVLVSSEISGNSVFYDWVTRAQPMEQVKLLGPVCADQKVGWQLIREAAGRVYGPLNALFAPISEPSQDVKVKVVDTDTKSVRVQTGQQTSEKGAAEDKKGVKADASKVQVKIVKGDHVKATKETQQVEQKSNNSGERTKAKKHMNESENSNEKLQEKSHEAMSGKDEMHKQKNKKSDSQSVADHSKQKETKDQMAHQDDRKAEQGHKIDKAALATEGDDKENAPAHQRRSKQAKPKEKKDMKVSASELEVRTVEGDHKVKVGFLISDAADGQLRQKSNDVIAKKPSKRMTLISHERLRTPDTVGDIGNKEQKDTVEVKVAEAEVSDNIEVEVIDSKGSSEDDSSARKVDGDGADAMKQEKQQAKEPLKVTSHAEETKKTSGAKEKVKVKVDIVKSGDVDREDTEKDKSGKGKEIAEKDIEKSDAKTAADEKRDEAGAAQKTGSSNAPDERDTVQVDVVGTKVSENVDVEVVNSNREAPKAEVDGEKEDEQQNPQDDVEVKVVDSQVQSKDKNIVVESDEDAKHVHIDVVNKAKQKADQESGAQKQETTIPAKTQNSGQNGEEPQNDVEVKIVDSQIQSRDENLIVEGDADAKQHNIDVVKKDEQRVNQESK